MDTRDKKLEYGRGVRWFRRLPYQERNVLGDQLVLGDFDWRDWFEEKPSAAFLRGVDDARIWWEMEQE